MKAGTLSIQNSALWAAYGDALGFITELVDIKGVQRRIRTKRATKTLPWARYLGGKYGARIELPAGCYSDDTQLRLATSRTIGEDGHFDVEIFAKIELPIWLSYSLGAGIGSKAAAESLKKADVNWFSNFFSNRNKSYLNAGGDGAAMRIQPHVWSASDLTDSGKILRDVIRNSLCTHGHPRGFLGSVFHALSLAHTIKYSEIPGPDKWEDFILFFRKAIEIIKNDNELALFWLPTWEKLSKGSISSACEMVIAESLEDLKIIKGFLNEKPENAYFKSVESIGCLTPQSRGSGIKTAILASANSWMFRNSNPNAAIEVAANTLNSDTDTIATMIGAIIGVLSDAPDYAILDREYIISEATRMYDISSKKHTSSQLYPDLFGWVPPKTQADSIGFIANRLALAGISFLSPKGKEYKEKQSPNFVWQWFELDFGQTIITRKRVSPKELPIGNSPVTQVNQLRALSKYNKAKRNVATKQNMLWDEGEDVKTRNTQKKPAFRSIEELFVDVRKTGYDPEFIGKCLLYLSELPGGIEKTIAFSALVSESWKNKIKAKSKR